MKHFPLYINLTDKKVLVIGGGKIAARRIHTLLSFTTNILVIAPDICDSLQTLITEQSILWLPKAYEKTDLLSEETPYMILAATNNRAINHSVFQDANEAHILVNVCDCPDECDFYFPAIIENDSITASITANGSNHSLVKELAAKIRKLLQETES